jgi:hypothetical protein
VRFARPGPAPAPASGLGEAPAGAHRPSRGWPPLIRSADSAHKPVLHIAVFLGASSVQLLAAASRSLPAVASHAIGFAEPRHDVHSPGSAPIEADGSGEPSGHGRAWATVLTCRVGPEDAWEREPALPAAPGRLARPRWLTEQRITDRGRIVVSHREDYSPDGSGMRAHLGETPTGRRVDASSSAGKRGPRVGFISTDMTHSNRSWTVPG